ncbi:hypothetical protein JOF28_002105 [Leucobacter exalbidus]|uniref:Uncharacterized protein n=1 Tax=Leucobacter exalbidus TaxID=662960 RepID=A0A940PPC9_9MICO|nr:hypothetical protein [Leucobacter exalbidus]MBP1326873.1 hypothetical protein [Leucobacter exalbidus]
MTRFAMIMGVLMAAWMTLGRWAFGLGGELTWWYLPTIGLGYIAVSYWLARRIAVTRARGRRIGRATVVTQILSWACAIGFGFTVPDLVAGQLQSILSHAAGSAFLAEMSIALCNPLGIVSFGFLGAAIAFAYADARDPKPEVEEYAGEGEMMRHPLA